jgi:hypothetical protein
METRKFDRGKQKFSKELYTIDYKEGYIIFAKDEKRKLKPSGILKADKVSIPYTNHIIGGQTLADFVHAMQTMQTFQTLQDHPKQYFRV